MSLFIAIVATVKDIVKGKINLFQSTVVKSNGEFKKDSPNFKNYKLINSSFNKAR